MKGRDKRMARKLQPAAGPELMTVTRPELVGDGSDAAFRAMIHSLLSYTRHVETVRDGFGALAGLTGVQYEIMMSVYRLAGADGVTVGEVAAWLHQSGAFITIETGRLAARGLLEKSSDPHDRRRVRLRLTPAGHATLAGLAPRQRQVNDVLFASLSAQDFQALRRTLDGLVLCGERAVHLIDFILKNERARAGGAGQRQLGDAAGRL